MSSLIPHVNVTKAIGAPLGHHDRSFDDLVDVGGWPVSQNIDRIELIEVFVTDSAVRGMRVTYLTTPLRPPILHGQAIGTRYEIPFDNNNMVLAGAFGARDAQGLISSISFVRFDTRARTNPPVRLFGPFGNSDPPTHTFGTYGNIIAFIGTDNNESGLRSLGFVKSTEYRGDPIRKSPFWRPFCVL